MTDSLATRLTPPPFLRALFSEFIGTFTLVLAGTGAVVINYWSDGAIGHPGIALVFGLVVMALIQAFGPSSGAHFNPAVTLSFATAGNFSWSLVPGYLGAQFLGAVLASTTLKVWFPLDGSALGSTLPKIGMAGSFWLEFVLTAILMLVIFRVATGSKEQGLLASIAIGAVVGLEAMFAGPACGASMNPARSLGPALLSGDNLALRSLFPVYFLGPILGALFAIVLRYSTLPPQEKSPN